MKSKRKDNLNDEEVKENKKKKLESSDKVVVTVDFTGIRDGETVEGINPKQTKGVEMIVKGDTYFPIRLIDTQYVRDLFGSFKFFSSMTLEERLVWLKENIKSYKAPFKENHLVDNMLKVKFIKIECAHFLEKIGVDAIQLLLAGNPDDDEGYWPIKDVYDLFKPKDKVTKANRHSLVFRPDNWRLKGDNQTSTTKALEPFFGTLISLFSACLPNVNNKNDDEEQEEESSSSSMIEIRYSENIHSDDERRKTLLLVNPDLALSLPLSLHEMPEFDTLVKMAIPLFKWDDTKHDEKMKLGFFHTIYKLIKRFTPSMLKSLIQKIIRTKAYLIEHDDLTYSSELFLIVAIITLARHPGSYNQNKHRYVTGLESVTKRLAVIIYEDSYIPENEYVTCLLAVAYMRQQNKGYIPPLNHFMMWFMVALDALESKHYYKYETSTDLEPQLTKSVKRNTNILNYQLLKKIGSFQGDINMFSYIASHPKSVYSSANFKDKSTSDEEEEEENDPIIMPLVHCLDQHCCTSIAHFMTSHTIINNKEEEDDDEGGGGGRGVDQSSFKNLFSSIWKEVSSVNGRKDYLYMLKMEKLSFVQNVRYAQRCIYDLKCRKEKKKTDNEMVLEEKHKKQYYEFEYSLDKSWICGLIGPIEVGKAIVVLRTDNIHEMVVIRKPKSRQTVSDMKSSSITKNEFTQEEKETLIELAKDKLRKGFELTHVPSTLDKFKSAKVWLSDDQVDEEPRYLIEFKNNGDVKVDWNDALRIQYSIPLFHDEFVNTIYSIKRAINYGKDGILFNADKKFDSSIKSYSLDVLKRLLMYINNYHEVIKLHEIARDGSSIHLSVSLLDIDVNHILCTICVLYPFCLKLEKTGAFHVKNGPFLWYLKGKIKALVSSSSSSFVNEERKNEWWSPLTSDESKPLYPHQRESVDTMLKKKLEEDKKGHGIFIEVGLGKTAIAIEYIGSLIEKGKMCDYCVYTAPPSAIENAKSEFSRYGLKYKMITESSSSSSRLQDFHLEKYVVNIIAHDHMRREKVHKELKRCAPNTLFIVDEFHLTSTTNTIRSSIALEISLLSWDFIAMTGTLIRRENPADVIHWLEQIVDFYVTGYNYWVAFGALISKKVKTNVLVKYDDIMVNFENSKEEAEYHSYVTSRLGGNASCVNFQKASQLCYNVVDRHIVSLVKERVLDYKEVVFVLALTVKHQQKLKAAIVKELDIDEKDVFLISSQASLVLRPEDETNIKVVITTLKHVTGYTLTKCKTSIGSVYPSNQASRDQFEGRMNRLGQLSPEINIITVHCGILSYLLQHYRKAASMSQALKEFASDINIDVKALGYR